MVSDMEASLQVGTGGEYGLVSVITPAYNAERFIPETIESVRSQTYTDWEMLIVDDGSTDGTGDIVARYADPRIRYIRHARTLGASEARNTALRNARGRWIAFLDSDDLWEPHKLERQLGFMAANGFSFTYTDYLETDGDSRPTGTWVTGPARIGYRGMLAYCWPGCLTVVYDSSLTGLVQADGGNITDDYAVWLQVVRHADCVLLPERLARHRRVTGSLSDRSYAYKIRRHYLFFRSGLNMNPVSACLMTLVNLAFGILKKIVYVRKEHQSPHAEEYL